MVVNNIAIRQTRDHKISESRVVLTCKDDLSAIGDSFSAGSLGASPLVGQRPPARENLVRYANLLSSVRASAPNGRG